ncbi:hypothetical protein LSUCC0031_04550 [Rhodobacterales bacterium LSUCC0031]|nr:hypothetical protein [Rhodobacterales bacterium LSUCC0031]
MSTQTASPTIEDSIKTALDAADAAITVSSEFDQIRTDYLKTRVEVKAINKQVMTVFISSLVASVLTVAVAGLIYFRTISEMQTTNATSLEALVIFAENVDRLAAATSEANAQAERINELVSGFDALQEHMTALLAQLDAQGETTLSELANVNTEITGLLSQSTSAVVREVSAAMADTQMALMAAMETLRTQPIEEGIEQAESGPSPFDEIKATLETMMMLQREISAKITAANAPPPAPARTAPPATPRAAPRDNDMIKFP